MESTVNIIASLSRFTPSPSMGTKIFKIIVTSGHPTEKRITIKTRF